MTQVLPSPRDFSSGLAARFRQALPDSTSQHMYVEMEGCLSVLVTAEVLRRRPVDASRSAFLRALRAAGTVNVGGCEVDLGDRVQGARFTDIVFIGPNGRVVH